MRLGSGDYGEWTFLDIVTLISFVIGLENLDMNITQNDMQEQTKEIDDRADARVDKMLTEIHAHLQSQDEKIEELLRRLS